MNIFLVVFLVLAGVALLLAEMFLLPGFGIAGVRGFGCLTAAVVIAYLWIGRLAGYITLGACLLLSGCAIWGFLRSKALDKMALDTKIDGHVELADNKLKGKASSHTPSPDNDEAISRSAE
jgi:membrane-bound ClpP family serine protease